MQPSSIIQDPFILDVLQTKLVFTVSTNYQVLVFKLIYFSLFDAHNFEMT